MSESLEERQEEYESSYDLTLTRRLPVVIRIQARNFDRLTKNLTKPICLDLHQAMSQAMVSTILEIQGAVFGYCQHNEIVLVLKNDQTFEAEPWVQNKLQKIVSVSASLATHFFYKASLNNNLDLCGDGIFDSKVCLLPYVSEVVNYLIWRQQSCHRTSVSSVVFHELSAKFGSSTANKTLNRRTLDEKIDLLAEHCDIEYEEDYPSIFRMGMAVYKIPTVIPLKDSSAIKNKWALNTDLPFFKSDKDFIYNILLNGHDVYRAPHVLGEKSKE